MARKRETVDQDFAARLLPGEKPTLRTLARLSGFAVATVSRALSDAPDIGDNTKNLVKHIAEAVGYVPNRAGVRLRTGKTNVISLLLPMTDEETNIFYSIIIRSISAEFLGTPYHLNVTPFFAAGDSLLPVQRIVENGLADGIIMNQIEPEDPRVAYLLERQFPFATHGRSKWRKQHAYFDFDNHAYVWGAMRKLKDRGRSSVLLLAPPLTQTYAQEMLRALTEAGKELSMTVRFIERPIEKIQGAESPSAFAAAIAQELKRAPHIDAVIAASIDAGLTAAQAVEKIKSVVGDTIDVWTKELQPFLANFRPDILTTFENASPAGTFLARAVQNAIAQPSGPPLQKLVGPEDI